MTPTEDALRNLVDRYAAYADARRLDDLAALFTEDGVLLTPGGTFAGGREIREHLAVLDRIERTEHVVTGVDLRLQADQEPVRATGRIAAEAHHITGDTDHVWTLTYLDDYVETPQGWRFSRREIDLISTEDRPITAH